MKQPGALWKLRARGLDDARRAVKRASPDGLHDLRVALRRIGATAFALGRKRIARRAKALSRSLSRSRRLEVDRRLLERVGRLGLLSPDAVTALAARWEKLAARAARRLARATDGKRMQRLRRRLARIARKGSGNGIRRLAAARRKAEAHLARSLEGKDDRTLHRYRLGVKKARDLADDLTTLGLPESTGAAREKALQETLGRWNDLQTFRKRLAEDRDEAAWRGAVSLAGELDRLLAALEPVVRKARAAAVAASRDRSRVVQMRRASPSRA
ncbi:MAG TPA: CHAD domain-containing protein [Thermoanaerobaculia bacterium]|nr:CHAD domain-containing protein [Thermoanaerobaculia bacterium]